MEGGRWPPFLRHYVVTVRCKVRVQRGDLQLRALRPAQLSLPPGRGAWSMRSLASSKPGQTPKRRPFYKRLPCGRGELLRGAIARNAKPGKTDQHQRQVDASGIPLRVKCPTPNALGFELNSPQALPVGGVIWPSKRKRQHTGDHHGGERCGKLHRLASECGNGFARLAAAIRQRITRGAARVV